MATRPVEREGHQREVLVGDVWKGVADWKFRVRVVELLTGSLGRFLTRGYLVKPVKPQTSPRGEIQVGTWAFERAKLVSRILPAPPVKLSVDMGTPELVVCACGVIARARAGTAVPWVHRCIHEARCGGRPLCPKCHAAFEEREGGDLKAVPFTYIVTFEATVPLHLVVQTTRSATALEPDLQYWRLELEKRLARPVEVIALDRWRPAGSRTLFG